MKKLISSVPIYDETGLVGSWHFEEGSKRGNKRLGFPNVNMRNHPKVLIVGRRIA